MEPPKEDKAAADDKMSKNEGNVMKIDKPEQILEKGDTANPTVALLKTKKSFDEFLIEGALPSDDRSYGWVTANNDLQKINKAIPIHLLEEAFKLRNFSVEFRILRLITETTDHAQALATSKVTYNRYPNVLPYKHNTINLPVEEDKLENAEEVSYINASYVSSCEKDSNKYFIAAQAPLDTTMPNFWKMIWVENVSAIVMLCRTKDEKTQAPQCSRYWPKETGATFEQGNFKITQEKEVELLPGLLQRDLVVENMKDKTAKPHYVRHYHCKKWPDQGVPQKDDYNQIDMLLQKLDEEKEKYPKSPVIIHCSAGIGRTGTLLALYNLKKTVDYCFETWSFDDFDEEDESKSNCKISIFATVRRIREQRWGSVQNIEQYIFIYEYIISYIKRLMEGKEVKEGKHKEGTDKPEKPEDPEKLAQ